MQRRDGKGKEKMEQAIDKTARALASLGHAASGKDHGPSKTFQLLIKNIGEAKTKHVSRYEHVGYPIALTPYCFSESELDTVDVGCMQ